VCVCVCVCVCVRAYAGVPVDSDRASASLVTFQVVVGGALKSTGSNFRQRLVVRFTVVCRANSSDPELECYRL
jgi:hypothetical protein